MDFLALLLGLLGTVLVYLKDHFVAAGIVLFFAMNSHDVVSYLWRIGNEAYHAVEKLEKIEKTFESVASALWKINNQLNEVKDISSGLKSINSPFSLHNPTDRLNDISFQIQYRGEKISEHLKRVVSALSHIEGHLGYYNLAVADSSVEETRAKAEQGDAQAQFSLGTMYHNGEGVPQAYAEAVKWYRKAADQGYAQAQTKLGVMYEEGEVVPKDDAEAAKWYRKAADQGYAQA